MSKSKHILCISIVLLILSITITTEKTIHNIEHPPQVDIPVEAKKAEVLDMIRSYIDQDIALLTIKKITECLNDLMNAETILGYKSIEGRFGSSFAGSWLTHRLVSNYWICPNKIAEELEYDTLTRECQYNIALKCADMYLSCIEDCSDRLIMCADLAKNSCGLL